MSKNDDDDDDLENVVFFFKFQCWHENLKNSLLKLLYI